MIEEKEKMTSFTFYELYYKAIELFDDVKAGKLTMRICNYMLDKECTVSQLTNKEEFYWLTIKDMLKEVKEIELQGKHSKKYNSKYKHFTFLDTYYSAMNFLNAHNKGKFIKGICNYMFYDKEPKFEDKETQMYFDFCKRQLDISKQRKEIGSKGGKQSKVKEIITKEPMPVKMSYIGFKKSHPQITGMLYGSVQNYINTLDWNRLSRLMERDSELNNKKDIYQLVKLYLNKYEGKNI